jgi:glycosyltransferase involved in cell wall biosynthesis
VPRYTLALARALDSVANEFPPLRMSLLTTEAGAAAIAPRTIDAHLPRLARPLRRGALRLAAEQVLAPFERARLLHFFDLSGPVFAPRRPFVATIHDAAVLRGGEFTPARRAYKRRLQPWVARRARRLIAVSNFAKDEAVRHLGADAERVTVIHSGPGLLETGGSGDATTPRDGPFLLYVGGLAANKNLPFLIRAFEAAAVSERLKLVGSPAPGAEEALDAVRSSRARDRIDVVSDASDADLDRLYRSATALVHPSRYEGFGFTPLEAMARGCPVIESDIPPLREVSGDGALMLPLDEKAWAEGIRRIVNDDSLREELRRRGAATAARYSWEETARALCKLFLSVAAAT